MKAHEWVGRDGEGDIQAYDETVEKSTNLSTNNFFKYLNRCRLVYWSDTWDWDEESSYHIIECLMPMEFLQ